MASSWGDLFRALGEAFSVLMTSEVASLREDLVASRRNLVRALVLAALAVFVFFWAIGAATIVLFEGLSIVFSRWLAALFVFLFLLSIGAILGMVARNRFRSLESPLTTAQRRLEDHLNWWQGHILAQDSPPPGPAESPSDLESERAIE